MSLWDFVLTLQSFEIYGVVPVFAFQALTALLSDDSKFGFIVIDGSGALFGTLQGNTREVLHKFTVDLPKKHGNLGREHEHFCFVSSIKEANCVVGESKLR